MTVRRWAVIDGNNIVVNTILIEDPMPANYWPGYGKYLLYQGPATKGEADSSFTFSSQLQQHPKQATFGGVTPFYGCNIGDFVNLSTGVVLRFVPNQIQQLQPDGSTVTVSSAPSVKLKDERS